MVCSEFEITLMFWVPEMKKFNNHKTGLLNVFIVSQFPHKKADLQEEA